MNNKQTEETIKQELHMSILVELVEREHEDYITYVSGNIFVDARIATMVVNNWLQQEVNNE